jgi:predicted permease
LNLLAVVVALVLLIGCANVACLLLARGVARQQEISIRLSLGAGGLRIVRQLMLESWFIALAGGAVGLILAVWAERLLLIMFQWDNRPIDLSPDWRVLTFSFAASVATGALFGMFPALQTLRESDGALNRKLKAAKLGPLRSLVVVEVACSLLLVAGATMFLRSFQNLRSTWIGFTPQNVSLLRLGSLQNEEDSPPPTAAAMQLADSLRGTTGISSVGLTEFAMFNDSSARSSLRLPGAPGKPQAVNRLRVNEGHFETLGLHLLSGRSFTPQDNEHSRNVTLVSENLARRLFPNENAVGKTLFLGQAALKPTLGEETQIIGVVSDVKFGSVSAEAPETVYLPLLQADPYSSTVTLEIRSAMQPEALGALIRARIKAEHLPAVLESAGSLEDEIGESLRTDKLRMQASSLFGVIDLMLVLMGIYGLMAYSVVRRVPEIGIRMALGSSPQGIIRMLLRESMGLVLVGVAVGVPAAVMAMKTVSHMVFGLSPFDPASLIMAVIILMVTGTVASVGPAWRASRVDPVRALSAE